MKDSVKPLMLIGGALLMGATTFLVIALFISSIGGTDGSEVAADPDMQEGGPSLLRSLSLAHAVIFLSALPIALWLSRGDEGVASDPGEAAMAQRTKKIMRWAPLEGAALFGIVIILLGGLNGTLKEHPIFYLNLLSYCVFALVVLFDLARLASED